MFIIPSLKSGERERERERKNRRTIASNLNFIISSCNTRFRQLKLFLSINNVFFAKIIKISKGWFSAILVEKSSGLFNLQPFIPKKVYNLKNNPKIQEIF